MQVLPCMFGTSCLTGVPRIQVCCPNRLEPFPHVTRSLSGLETLGVRIYSSLKWPGNGSVTGMHKFEDDTPTIVHGESRLKRLTLAQLRTCWTSQIRSRCTVTPLNCFSIGGTPTKKSGYVQVSIANTKYTAHIVSYLLWYRTYDPALTVSHRCHTATCVNPTHLCQETLVANEDRKRCITSGSWTTCPHLPKCIGHHSV
jgi:hypothetical protein